ncbi:hypothetical protein GGI05_005073, partial [Coemansia sp. RSA 2603]
STIATASSTSSAGVQGHHPALQQMSRERKQQLRHQNRMSQKAVSADGGEPGAESNTNTGSKESGDQSCAKDDESPLGSDSADTKENPSTGSASLEKESNTESKTDSEQIKAQERQQPHASDITSDGTATDAATGVAAKQAQDVLGSADTKASTLASDSRVLEGESAPISHTNSALSFQNITDSLFAQLNAKVSTPSNSALPAFAGASTYEGHPPGLRANASYPISSVDPLLFNPSIGSESTATGVYGRAGGPLNSASPFSLFGGVNQAQASSTQWGGLGSASGQFTQSPLSALRGDTSSIGGSLSSRDLPISSGIGSASRQRSRWDFVQPDEASAQAELQSVLGRSNSNGGSLSATSGMFGSQQASAALAFTNSRDLGLFATPVQNDYTLGGPWSGFSSQGAESVNTAPFPPPGFSGPKTADGSLQTESRTRSPLVSGATASSGIIGSSAPNNLLSRLIGQNGGDLGGTVSDNGGQQSQDPAILSSYMAAAVSASSPQQQQHPTQNSRTNSSKTDPNVLNSLLARLHLGQGNTGSPLSSIGTPQGSSLSSNAFGSRAGSVLNSSQPQQQSVGPMMPPGILSAAGPGSATSPVYNGSQFGAMGMGALDSNMMTAASRSQQQQQHQQQHIQQQQLLQQFQQLNPHLNQQQQQSLLS